MAAAAEPKPFLEILGPQSDVNYPVRVLYCGECSVPIEYCEYYPNYEKCKAWLEKNVPKEFEKLSTGKEEESPEAKDDGAKGEKKRQTRGGKAMMKTKKKVEPQGIKLWSQSRGKKRKVTIVGGLASYEIDLKEASKFFAGRFSCGSSINEDEIIIQGDVKDELFDILPEKWSVIDEDSIDDCGEKKA